jgi:PAS domain S-box-containing protein
LARRGANEIVYLSHLQRREVSDFPLRLPLAGNKLLAARGALGFEGVINGFDYAGVPVLAAVRRVPDTPWILVAKIDLEEVHAPIERQTFWLALFGCSVLLTIGPGVAFTLRDLRMHFEIQRYRAELQERTLRGHYDYLSRFSNDIILLANRAGLILEANDRAVNAYGYSLEELIGMPLKQLRAETLPDFELDGKRAESEDGMIIETRHIRKHGSSFPFEMSARRVTVDDAVFWQNIIRDITERKEAEKERTSL